MYVVQDVMHCMTKTLSLQVLIVIHYVHFENFQIILKDNIDQYVGPNFAKLSNCHLVRPVGRPNFLEMCEQWRNDRNTTSDNYRDVYDGKVWEDFQEYNGQPFLSFPNNLALMLNVDWFQPFEHTKHSEGVIYLAIMNLP